MKAWIAEKMIENSREQELLACYRKLNEEKQDAVLQNVKWLAEGWLRDGEQWDAIFSDRVSRDTKKGRRCSTRSGPACSAKGRKGRTGPSRRTSKPRLPGIPKQVSSGRGLAGASRLASCTNISAQALCTKP